MGETKVLWYLASRAGVAVQDHRFPTRQLIVGDGFFRVFTQTTPEIENAFEKLRCNLCLPHLKWKNLMGTRIRHGDVRYFDLRFREGLFQCQGNRPARSLGRT